MELLVVLTLMALSATLASVAFQPGTGNPVPDVTRSARAEAIRSGGAVTRILLADSLGEGPQVLRFLPDGRVIGPGVDPLTGNRQQSCARPEVACAP